MKYLYIFILFLMQLSAPAQRDTLNQLDAASKKQGYWIFYGSKNSLKCTDRKQKLEEGRYLDDKKTGIWTEYYCSGKAKSVITYENGRPFGPARMYYESGQLKEQGVWKGKQWVGKYELFSEDGKLIKEFMFDEEGKRLGPKTSCSFGENVVSKWDIFKDNKLYVRDSSKNLLAILFFKDGVYNHEIDTKTGKKIEKTVDKRSVTEDGLILNGALVTGKKYIYNKEGILFRVMIFKEGCYIGDAILDK